MLMFVYNVMELLSRCLCAVLKLTCISIANFQHALGIEALELCFKRYLFLDYYLRMMSLYHV